MHAGNYNHIEELFNTMMQMGKLINLHTQESHEERNATMLQFAALNFLKYAANHTVGDVSEFLHLSKSSGTQLIERLVMAQFVKRIADQKDLRITRIALTAKGENEIIVLKKKIILKIGKIFEKVPKKDITDLIRIHSSIIKTLEESKL